MSYFLIIFIGLFAGILSGLLGLGGGVVIVPCLNALFEWQKLPHEIQMHLAIGTSLATMVMTTGAVAFAHHKRKAIYWPYLKWLIPGIVLGALIGVFITKHLSTAYLEVLFGCFCLLLSFYMFISKNGVSEKKSHPHPSILFVLALGIGIISSLLGVGGGIILIPLLIHLGLDLRQAMATSITSAFVTTITASMMAMVAGWHSPHLPPHTLGFVLWPLALMLGVSSMVGAPLGVRLVHHLPMQMTKRIFAGILCGVAFKMLLF